MLSVRGYKLPIAVSLLLHGLVMSLFFVNWPETISVPEPVPEHVTAQVIQIESAAEKERKRKVEDQKRQKDAQARRAEQQRKQVEAAKKEAAIKAAAEKKAQDAALKLKAEQDKKEAAQKAAEKKKQEQQRADERALMETLLEEQLAQVAAAKEAQEKARKEGERVTAVAASFTDQIKAHISSYWSYPSNVNPSQEVTVQIRLVPTGEVIQVVIVKSSGNAALDRSVEQAISKASPLPVPKEMLVFEKNFRSFTLKFRPENASW